MVAIVDGNPLPPEHIQTTLCVSGTTGAKDESKHCNASFIIHLTTPSTPSYHSKIQWLQCQ